MSKPRLDNPITAALTGAADLFKKRKKFGELNAGDRIEGKTVLITGANSGLGFASSVDLAKRGGQIIMACRSGIPEAGEQVKSLSGSQKVEVLSVDLSDLDSISRLIDELKKRNQKIDILVLNAAVVPAHSRKTKQGLEEMFMVNYFSSFILVKKILEEQLLNKSALHKPRIVFTASEAHRSSENIDWQSFGQYQDFTMGKAVAYYGYYKLMLTTFAQELHRILNAHGKDEVYVLSLCPGAVNTNIAKEAPSSLKPVIKFFFGIFFSDPFKANEPILYFACAKESEIRNGMYLHLMAEKSVDPRASDPENGKQLREKSQELLSSLSR